MNYYTQSEDGTIKDFANWQFDDSAIATDKEIVIGYDGKYYFVGEEPAQPIEEVRKGKLAEVMRGYTEAFAEIEKTYPQAEREGWPLQEEEAKALQEDPNAPTPVLNVLVAQRGKGETIQELATKVLQNASIWRTLYAWYTGQQQRQYSEVSALTAAEDILAYQVSYIAPKAD